MTNEHQDDNSTWRFLGRRRLLGRDALRMRRARPPARACQASKARLIARNNVDVRRPIYIIIVASCHDDLRAAFSISGAVWLRAVGMKRHKKGTILLSLLVRPRRLHRRRNIHRRRCLLASSEARKKKTQHRRRRRNK